MTTAPGAKWKAAFCLGLLFALPAVSIRSSAGEQAPTALVGALLIDGTGATPLPDSIVVFRDGRVVQAGARSEVEIPRGAEVIDATGLAVLPGLIESNGHVVFNGQIDHAAFFASRHSDFYALGARNVYTALRQGITTIRDTMGPPDELMQLRSDIENGKIAGSRLFIAGSILNYQSLLDIPTDRVLDPSQVAAARRSMDLFVDDAPQGIAIIRDYAARGVDFIKISAAGSAPGGERPVALSTQVLRQLVDEVHRLGLKATAHTVAVPELDRALQAGFDALEHPEFLLPSEPGVPGGVPMPDKLLQQIVQRRIYSVPLVVAAEVYLTYMETPALLDDPAVLKDLPADLVLEARSWIEKENATPGALEERKAFQASVRDNLRRMIAAGALIAMGTDKGTRFNYHEHGNHVREMEIYVELGMQPMDAIVAATRHGAELLGVESELGTIAAGMKADLVVVRGNPASRIADMGNIVMVFKDGIRYR